MAERVRAEWGAPSLVINSAGAGEWRFLEETSPEQIVEMLGAPYLAAANTSAAFIADMLAAGRGLLVHVGSPASVMPWPGATAYTASRWALRGLHEALHMDLAGTGVRSSLVYFGEVSSEYFEANPDSHQHIPTIGAWIPVSTPERCAEVNQLVFGSGGRSGLRRACRLSQEWAGARRRGVRLSSSPPRMSTKAAKSCGGRVSFSRVAPNSTDQTGT